LRTDQAKEYLGNLNVCKMYSIPLLSDSDESVTLHTCGKCSNFLDESLGYPFAEICTITNANPFSHFNLLVNKRWLIQSANEQFKKNGDVMFDFSSALANEMYLEYNVPIFSQTEPFEFEYSEKGCKQLLRTVSALESTNVNSTTLLSSSWDENFTVNYSHIDDCYYTYIIKCTQSNAYITALYFRSNDGKFITDATAQILYIAFPYGDFTAGSSISISYENAKDTLGIMSFLMSLERTFTGNCYFSKEAALCSDTVETVYVLPGEYEGANYSATINGQCYKPNLDYQNRTYGEDEIFTYYAYSVKLK